MALAFWEPIILQWLRWSNPHIPSKVISQPTYTAISAGSGSGGILATLENFPNGKDSCGMTCNKEGVYN